MGVRTDIGDKCKGGGIEEGQTNPLKDPHHEKGPKREGKRIGNEGEDKKDGTADHKVFFRSF